MMQTMNVTLTVDGKYKQTRLSKGETKSGNIVYKVINLPVELKSVKIMEWLNQVSLARVSDFVIDYTNNGRKMR